MNSREVRRITTTCLQRIFAMLRCQICSKRRRNALLHEFWSCQGLATASRSVAWATRKNYSTAMRSSKAVAPTARYVYDYKKNKDGGPSIKARITHDPLKLAEQIRGLLRKDKVEDAEEVVRFASKGLDQFTVSWNHLIDWKMTMGKASSAIKTYQEMKKRGQAPDAHTYTIILKGLAEHSRYPHALTKALAIYHSMSAANSPVEPTIIHTNAALKVCGRTGDINAMFEIAGKLSSKGPNAADNLTFTIILNTIRQNSLVMPSDLESSEIEERRSKTIIDARRMWDDIVGRWRKGDFWIDEELVCSMGRLLLLGKNKDVDDILSLIEQTMNIPRLLPRIGTEARARIEPSMQGKLQPEVEGENLTELVQENPHPTPADEFKPIRVPSRSRGQSGYARPGPNTLSLVLEVSNKLHSKSITDQYWQILTKSHNVIPDSQNFISYLRNLRVFRASSETVSLLKDMPTEMMEKKTFRIALSTCVRDKKNLRAFANAGKILDLMQMNLADPDIAALDSYLEVAITSPAISNKATSDAKRIDSDSAQARQILRALERLGPHIINLKSINAYGEFGQNGAMTPLQLKAQQDLLDLLKRTVSAYDLLLNKGIVERNTYHELKARRSKIAAMITRYKEKRVKIELKAADHAEKKRSPSRFAPSRAVGMLNSGSA